MLMLDAKGMRITPAIARQMMAKITLKFGDVEGLDFWAEMHPSQAGEWENCAIHVHSVTDDNFRDGHLPKRTFMGFPLELNAHLSPAIVLIRKNHEIVAEIARLGLTNCNMEEVNA